MSDTASFDSNWWKAEKAMSLERKAREKISSLSLAKPGDAFLIVTEGTVTEPVYFDLLLQELQLSVVRIKVQPGDDSDPRHVIETAAREAKEQVRRNKNCMIGNGPSKYDQVWAVVDTDVAVRQGFWKDVKQLAKSKKVMLAHSTPCFEFWLLLHIAGYTTRSDLHNGDAAKSAVKSALGREYSTTGKTARESISSFFAKWTGAVKHAESVRRHHQAAATPEPANPSTEMDLLARALNDSAPQHMRKLR
jgi:hypothetical protein